MTHWGVGGEQQQADKTEQQQADMRENGRKRAMEEEREQHHGRKTESNSAQT